MSPSLINRDISIPVKYDVLNIKKEIPLFRVPLHGTFDGMKIIPEFSIKLLEKEEVVYKQPHNGLSKFVFLQNFGTCQVLKGLKDCSREFNVLCGIDLFSNHVLWLYLSNEEYADLLITHNKSLNYNEVENVGNRYQQFSVGKIYNSGMGTEISGFHPGGGGLYKDYKLSVNRYDKSDHHGTQTIIGINSLGKSVVEKEFLVLEIHSLIDDVSSLEQQEISYNFRHKIVADQMYLALGVGEEFMGYFSFNNTYGSFKEVV